MTSRLLRGNEFDRSILAKNRVRTEGDYLFQTEKNPSPAVAFDSDLLHRAKDRSDTSHVRTSEIRVFKNSATSSMNKKWASTQRDKKNRITRDLQFELAINTILEFKKKSSNIVHRDALQGGIEAFELSLFKNGIGTLFSYGHIFIL